MSTDTASSDEAVTVVADPTLEYLDFEREARGEFVEYSLKITKVVRVPKSERPATRIERVSPGQYRAYKKASDRAWAEYQSALAAEKND